MSTRRKPGEAKIGKGMRPFARNERTARATPPDHVHIAFSRSIAVTSRTPNVPPLAV